MRLELPLSTEPYDFGEHTAAAGGAGDGSGAGGQMPPPRPGIAWERRSELGPGAAVLQTIRQVLLAPSAAFRAMRVEGGWAEPLAFAVLIGSISLWVAQAWSMLVNTLLLGMGGMGAQEIAAANVSELAFAMAAPLLVCVATVFGAAVVHVLLIMFGGAPRPFEATFRVMCYSWSVGVLNLIPICGVLIGAVWRVVVQIIGVREAQQVPTGRAAAAVLIPLILTCFCLVLAIIASVGLAGLAQMGLQ